MSKPPLTLHLHQHNYSFIFVVIVINNVCNAHKMSVKWAESEAQQKSSLIYLFKNVTDIEFLILKNGDEPESASSIIFTMQLLIDVKLCYTGDNLFFVVYFFPIFVTQNVPVCFPTLGTELVSQYRPADFRLIFCRTTQRPPIYSTCLQWKRRNCLL